MGIGSLVKILKTKEGTVFREEIKGCLGVIVGDHKAPMGFTVWHVHLMDGRKVYCRQSKLELVCE